MDGDVYKEIRNKDKEIKYRFHDVIFRADDAESRVRSLRVRGLFFQSRIRDSIRYSIDQSVRPSVRSSVPPSICPSVRHAVEIFAVELSKPYHCPCPPLRDGCCRVYGLVSSPFPFLTQE